MPGYLWSRYFRSRRTTPATGNTFFAAVRSYLLAVDGLESLTGVYLNRTPVNPIPTPPYMILSGVGGTIDISSKDWYQDNAEIQFSLVAPDDVTAETLGAVAFEALRPKSTNPKFSGPTFSESYRMAGTRPVLMPQGTRWSEGNNLWDYHFGIVFSVSRP